LNGIVNIIPGGNLATSLSAGSSYPLTVTCTLPCNGTGLAATFTVTNGFVTGTTLSSVGCGYDPGFPPLISSSSAPDTIFEPTFAENLQSFAVVARVGTHVGGLSATYYAAQDLLEPVRSVIAGDVPDFSHTCDRRSPAGCPGPRASLPSGDGFSMRWAGHAQTPGRDMYTFSTALGQVRCPGVSSVAEQAASRSDLYMAT
jgi:hypothetical protein